MTIDEFAVVPPEFVAEIKEEEAAEEGPEAEEVSEKPIEEDLELDPTMAVVEKPATAKEASLSMTMGVVFVQQVPLSYLSK